MKQTTDNRQQTTGVKRNSRKLSCFQLTDYCSLKNGSAWVGLLLLLSFVTTIGLALAADITKTIAQTKKASQTMIAQALCDAGIEKAIWKLNQGAVYSGETNLTIGNGDLDIAITDINTEHKVITTTAYVPSKESPKTTRTVRARIQATPNEEGVAFRYALQAGEGGINVGGSSEIHGNLYSNGPVNFSGGAYRVTGDVMAHTTVTPNPNPRVEGTITTGVPIVPLPQINTGAWKSYAEAGGTIFGNYSPAGTLNLGPKKITGNFSMSGASQIVNLTGPLYVQGNMNLTGGKFVLGNSFGTDGTIIIVDGTVSISGGTQFVSNASGGYILVVSLSDSDNAITYNGTASSEGLALFALNGGMTLGGSGEIVATCGKTLNISGSGEILYKSGLASANFSAGPGGSWEIKEWQIVH